MWFIASRMTEPSNPLLKGFFAAYLAKDGAWHGAIQSTTEAAHDLWLFSTEAEADAKAVELALVGYSMEGVIDGAGPIEVLNAEDYR